MSYELFTFTGSEGTVYSNIEPLSYVQEGVWMSNAPRGAMTIYKSACLDVYSTDGYSFGMAIFNAEPLITPSKWQSSLVHSGDYWYIWIKVVGAKVESTRCPTYTNTSDWRDYVGDSTPPFVITTSNGGGATHIAKVTGQLKDLSSNLSDILMVSGGGGGGYIVGEDAYVGADAGGIQGSNYKSGTQSTGYAFGQGEST